MKIGFDIDGVVYDFHRAVYPALRHTGLTARSYERFWTCEVNKDHDIHRDIWNSILQDESFFHNPPIDLVVPYLQKLNIDHELHYVTKRHPALEEFTREWFMEHSIPFSKLVFAQDKVPHVKDLDWFVEDNPGNAVLLYPHVPIILIRKPWNVHLREEFPMYDHISQIKGF
jgi:uncharacterized HAD superfamily protein